MTLILFGLLAWGAVNIGVVALLVLGRRRSVEVEPYRLPEAPLYAETLAS